MGNDRRKNKRQFFEEKKRSDINPSAIFDKIDEVLKRANQLKINYIIEEILQLKKDADKHGTNKDMLRKIYTKLTECERVLVAAERNKLPHQNDDFHKTR